MVDNLQFPGVLFTQLANLGVEKALFGAELNYLSPLVSFLVEHSFHEGHLSGDHGCIPFLDGGKVIFQIII